MQEKQLKKKTTQVMELACKNEEHINIRTISSCSELGKNLKPR